MKNFRYIILVLFFLPLISCKAQIPVPIDNDLRDQTNQLRESILGNWYNDDGSVKQSYTSDGISKVYYNGILEDTYTWIITTTYTPSGLKISNLTISNEDETYSYEIDVLSESKMILVYNTGIGLSRNLYYRNPESILE